MPTAGKLVAAIMFAGLAALATYLIIPQFPEGTNFDWFMPGYAVVSVFELGVDYLRVIASAELVIFLVLGGIICGLVTDFFAQRYP